MSAHHHHTHENAEDTYYLDQLCMVALSAAFGGICLALYFWQLDMLKLMLGPQFHTFILGSGVVLLVLAVVRGAILWVQVGKTSPHSHDHLHEDHDLEAHPTVHAFGATATVHHEPHQHDHASCGHDHGTCGLDHDHGHHHHDHPHEHVHHHGDHDHADHDHSWAPWRYVVLLIPIVLFLLGLPNKGPKVGAATVDLSEDLIRQAKASASLLAMGPPSLSQVGMLPGVFRPRNTGKAMKIDFRTLEGAAANENLRRNWQGKRVTVLGQFVPDRKSNKVFFLARFKMQCCAGDAVQLNVPILADESINVANANDWVKVTGEVEFFQDGALFRTILRVHTKEDVEKASPDPDPYI
jgi:hypothetical protein